MWLDDIPPAAGIRHHIPRHYLALLEEFERANAELAELIPELDGLDLLEAILAKSHATVWTELTEQTMSLAEQAAELAEWLDAHAMIGPATARLSHAHGMRGRAGDLERGPPTPAFAGRWWARCSTTPRTSLS